MCLDISRGWGWTEIDAIVVETEDHLTAELVEIDENLFRAELTPAQRAAHIKRRKVIWEALHPSESGTSCPTLKTGRGNKQFASDTESATSESKRDINRHVARAEALGDDINSVVGTSLDKGVAPVQFQAVPKWNRRK